MEDGSDGEVVDGRRGCDRQLPGIVRGEAEVFICADESAGCGGGEIVLANVQAVKARGCEEMGAVVEDEGAVG